MPYAALTSTPSFRPAWRILVLKREAHELRFVVAQGAGKLGSALDAQRAAAVLNVAEVSSRNAKPLRELGEALAFTLAYGRQGAPECQRTFHQFLEVRDGGTPTGTGLAGPVTWTGLVLFGRENQTKRFIETLARVQVGTADYEKAERYGHELA